MPPTGATSGRCPHQWTITGEVVLIGEAPAPVKLAGFYTRCNDFYYASAVSPKCAPARMVSNVAALGPGGGDFSLAFDVASLQPASGHYIYLILWSDENGNGSYDPGEEWKYVIPLYDDRMFQQATDCVYFFDERADEMKGTQPGWNQSAGLERYVPIAVAPCDGAKLSNETAWSPHPSMVKADPGMESEGGRRHERDPRAAVEPTLYRGALIQNR